MSRRPLRLATSILAACLAAPAMPAEPGGFALSVTITQVRVDANGHGIIFLSTDLTNGAACAQSGTYHNALAFDASTVGGQQVLQLALIARDTNGNARIVSAYGSGVCNTYPGVVEDIQRLVVR